MKLTIHEDIDEEDLHGVERIGELKRGAEGDQGESSDRCAQLEGEEILNIVEDRFAWIP